MNFSEKLAVDKLEVQKSLGYKKQAPEEMIQKEIDKAVQTLEQAESAKWVWGVFALEGTSISPSGVSLAGKDIAEHLKGCHSCILLAITLGARVEQVTRAAQATNMQQAIMLDIAASTLIEQYADVAQRVISEKMESEGHFLTSRYSPGYGDLPLAIQPDFLRVLNTQRAIGLTCNESFLLLPRKSITAFIGVADHPVKGKLAGCAHCVLREKCKGSCLCSA